MTTAAEYATKLDAFVVACGSRITCSPPPENTDHDFLVHVDAADLPEIVSQLTSMGFHWEGNEHYQDAGTNGFMSWRKDDQNLIVTANPEFALQHQLATALCKKLNLMFKPDRIAVFEALLYRRVAA